MPCSGLYFRIAGALSLVRQLPADAILDANALDPALDRHLTEPHQKPGSFRRCFSGSSPTGNFRARRFPTGSPYTVSRMRVTELALIEEPVQRQYDLVRIFAFGLPQMPELDQPSILVSRRTPAAIASSYQRQGSGRASATLCHYAKC